MQNDCTILLERALKGKTLACFGVDGNGLHGHSYASQHFKVHGVSMMLDSCNDSDYPSGVAIIHLADYDAAAFGHVLTDRNFELSFNALLKNHDISTSCWSWGELRAQLQHCVILNIDAEKLIQW